MAKWPAVLDDPVPDHGTVYVSPGRLMIEMERHGFAGQAFRFRKWWTTYQPNKRQTYRNGALLKPESKEDFENIMGSCQAAGMNPPVSFAEPFRHVFRSPILKKSVLSPFDGFVFGGWQEAMMKTPGTYKGKVYWYDINGAYRWAASVGLPDPDSAFPLERPDFDRPSIYLVEGGHEHFPYWYQNQPHVMTNEEGLTLRRKVKILRGVGFEGPQYDLRPTFEHIEKHFPFCHKRIGRAFWGGWNSYFGPERVTWKRGRKENELHNPFYNPLWSAFLTSRIKLRFTPYMANILHVFVDGMLTTAPIETGPGPGEWRSLGEFRSIWIRWVGYWGSQWETVKHAGEKFPMARDGAIIDARPWRENLA